MNTGWQWGGGGGAGRVLAGDRGFWGIRLGVASSVARREPLSQSPPSTCGPGNPAVETRLPCRQRWASWGDCRVLCGLSHRRGSHVRTPLAWGTPRAVPFQCVCQSLLRRRPVHFVAAVTHLRDCAVWRGRLRASGGVNRERRGRHRRHHLAARAAARVGGLRGVTAPPLPRSLWKRRQRRRRRRRQQQQQQRQHLRRRRGVVPGGQGL